MKEKNKKIQCIPLTEYALLIFLLLNDKKLKDVNFIFVSGFDSKIIERIKKKYNGSVEVIKRIKWLKKFEVFWFKLQYIIRFKKNENLLTYGQDHYLFNFFFKNDMYLLEDGIGNYREYEKLKKIFKLSKSKEFFLKILTNKKCVEFFGRGKNIKKIYLTGIATIPKDIEDKVEIINLKELWDKKTTEEKNEILDIFGIGEELNKKKFNNKIIFLTQPLYESNLLTYEEEILLYKEILKKYSKEKIIIKPHPREKKIYKEIFPEVEILEGNFPFEFFNLLEIKIERAVTVMSSAVLNLNDKIPVDFYGTEIHPKLLEKCGKIDLQSLKKKNSV